MNINKETTRKINPRENANPISALFFLYMIPIFIRNYKKGLKEEDVFQVLREDKASDLGDRLQNVWKRKSKQEKSFPLYRSIFEMFWLELFIYGFFQLVIEIFLVAAVPLVIGGFVSYFESEDVTDEEVYMYGGLLVLLTLLDTLLSHGTTMGLLHLALKISASCCSLIYRKALNLSQASLAKDTTGHIIDLISNDVSNIEYGFLLVHYLWITPIQICVGTYLLYRTMGVSALSGVSILLLFVPLQAYFGKKLSEFQYETILITDERLGLLSEIFNGIKVIKMYTWEKPFAALISKIRKSEISIVKKSMFLEAITFSLQLIIPGVATFTSILVFISLGNDINAQIIYSVLAIYDAMKPSLSMFTSAISSVAELQVTLKRIEAYLKSHEFVYPNEKLDQNDNQNEKCPRLLFENVSCQWTSDTSEMTLKNINLSFEERQLIAVVGPVGSGKSSLFNVILRELPVTSGKMELKGTVSYACQEPWLFSGSVRQNILFGNEYNESKYWRVIKVCGLEADLMMFPDGDYTLVGEKGKIISGGQKARISLARCVYKEADIYLLDDPLSAVDGKVGELLYDECISKFLKDKLCILITHQLQYLKTADKIIQLDDGEIVATGSFDELQSSETPFGKILQLFDGEKELDEEKELEKRLSKNLALPEDDYLEVEAPKETMLTGKIKFGLYIDYFKSGGSYFTMFLLLIGFIVSQGISSFSDYFISYWVNLEQMHAETQQINSSEPSSFDRTPIMITYSVLTILTNVVALIQTIFFFLFFLRAAIKIHDTTFMKVCYATMRFFNDNPTGRILNRFSEDLKELDAYTSGVLGDVIQIFLQLCGAIVVTSVINPWLILPALGLMVLFYLFRIVYLETSRTVKRIEGLARSNIFSHMTATLQGISTIRACSAQEILKIEFDNYQDIHSSTWHIFIASSSAFTFWLDMICTLLVAIVIAILLIFNKDYYAGDAGLILTEYIGLTGMIQWGMHQWTELENHMTSVERVFEYKTLESEPSRKQLTNVPRNWPEYGKIVFQKVSMKYNDDDPYVLKDLDFVINSNEKVGIVGRTGAGKSSIAAVLFQLYVIEGPIIIDGVNTTLMPLDELRSKISIIPQEPVLFSGTIRKNLDPFEQYDDEVIWNALELVELKEFIKEIPLELYSRVTENGSNFSVGQKQLLCLARAIIRKNKILIMDEATANVDAQTDEFIQKTIQKEFQDCTVITIAHRLHTIMDSDKVLVMDAGKMVEFDSPNVLLQNVRGRFYSMVHATGKNVAKNLIAMAENSSKKNGS